MQSVTWETSTIPAVPDAAELQLLVTDELKTVRQHGVGRLDELDRKSGQPKVPPTPHLERAAKEVPGYTDNLTRSASIELLLIHEIPLVQAGGYNKWLPASYCLTDETRGKSPTDGRLAARRLAGNSNKNTFVRSDGGTEVKAIGALAAQIVKDCLVSLISDSALNPAVSEAANGSDASPIREAALPREGEADLHEHELWS